MASKPIKWIVVIGQIMFVVFKNRVFEFDYQKMNTFKFIQK